MNTAIVTILALAWLPQSGVTNHKTPIEKVVAGYSVLKSGTVVARDSKSGCYLVRSGE